MKIAKIAMISAAVMMISSLATAVELTNDGKIVSIDKTTGTAKIEHGPPVGTTGSAANRTFTYDYKAKSASMLDGLQAGDKVRFTTEGEGQNWTMTKVQKQ